jgi:hypothetical protein
VKGKQIFDEINAKKRQVDELKSGMSAVKGAGTKYAAYQVLEEAYRKAEVEYRTLLETDYYIMKEPMSEPPVVNHNPFEF